jgi:hypothetical protein
MDSISVKNVTETTATIEGYGIVFGGRDEDGDTFTKNTNLYLEHYQTVPTFYDHKMAKVKRMVGAVTSAVADEVGVKYTVNIDMLGKYVGLEDEFYEEEVAKAKAYARAIVRLAKAKLLGMSTGSLPHIAKRDENKHFTDWPPAELSLTVIPAESRTKEQLNLIKTLAGDPSLEALLSEVAEIATEQSATVNTSPTIEVITNNHGENPMSENDGAQNADPAYLAMLETQQRQSDQIDSILKMMQSDPVYKQKKIIAPDSGGDHPEVKSFADQMIAIQNGNTERLEKVYKSTQIESSGDLGGWTVNEQQLPGIYNAGEFTSPIVNMCTNVPNAAPFGRMPTLDIYAAPATGATAYAGGVVLTETGEAGTYTETNVNFENLTWDVQKSGGIIPVSEELVADTSAPLVALLQQTARLSRLLLTLTTHLLMLMR